MIAFLEPLATRIRERNLCFHCKAPMVARCNVHRVAVCGDLDCIAMHRLGRNGSQWGSLTKAPGCLLMRPLRFWIVVRNCAIALGVGVIFALAVIW